jgi:hypothetical protein
MEETPPDDTPADAKAKAGNAHKDTMIGKQKRVNLQNKEN